MRQIEIKQGIKESGWLEGLPELGEGNNWIVCLVNPSTKERYEAVVNPITEDNRLVFTWPAEQTETMTVGTYNFEVYDTERSIMFSQDDLYVVKSSNLTINKSQQ